MTLGATNGGIRKAYVDSAIGQLHIHYVAPPQAERCHRPLILLGASPASGIAYSELLAELGTDRIAVAFDNPGTGESASPDEPFTHPSQLAALFCDAISTLALGVVDSYGHHSGAMMALALAAYHPEQVGRVAVSAVPYICDPTRRAILRARYPTIDMLDPLLALHAQHFSKIAKRPADLSFERAVELHADSLRAGVRMNWLIRASYAEGTDRWLTKIAAPVMFLQTANSLRDATLDAAALTPRATIRERPDLDHFALWTHAAEIGRELRAAFDPA